MSAFRDTNVGVGDGAARAGALREAMIAARAPRDTVMNPPSNPPAAYLTDS